MLIFSAICVVKPQTIFDSRAKGFALLIPKHDNLFFPVLQYDKIKSLNNMLKNLFSSIKMEIKSLFLSPSKNHYMLNHLKYI